MSDFALVVIIVGAMLVGLAAAVVLADVGVAVVARVTVAGREAGRGAA